MGCTSLVLGPEALDGKQSPDHDGGIGYQQHRARSFERLGAKQMAVLGSGDIMHHCHRKVSCSYALRHGYSLKRGTHFYFWTTFLRPSHDNWCLQLLEALTARPTLPGASMPWSSYPDGGYLWGPLIHVQLRRLLRKEGRLVICRPKNKIEQL